MIESAIGIVRSAGPAARSASETSSSRSAIDHQRRVEGGPDERRAVGVGVVGGAGHGRREHEQDRRHERDVGRGRLAHDVEDDGEEQRADRDVRRGGVDRMAEPDAVEEVLDRPDRAEEGAEPALVEVPERTGPAVLGGDQAGDQTTHACDTSQGECIHRPSTSPATSGITF